MTQVVTYPGVYASIITSPNPPTAGIATSTTLMVGRAIRGPVLQPVTIFCYNDYLLTFGGLDEKYPLSYAVYQFFLNGGGQAIIVRAYEGNVTAATATIKVPVSGTATPFLYAASPGVWGNYLTVVATRTGSSTGDPYTYSLTITYKPPVGSQIVETYNGISSVTTGGSSADRASRLDKVVAQSQLVTISAADVIDPGITVNGTVTGTNDEAGADSETLIWQDYSAAYNAVPDETLFNILVLPQEPLFWTNIAGDLYPDAATFCVTRQAFLLVDPPPSWETDALANNWDNIKLSDLPQLDEDGQESSAVYFPSILAADPLSKIGAIAAYPPAAFMAGLYAQTDGQIGVWAIAAGLRSPIGGAVGLTVPMGNNQNGMLYLQGINCLRSFSIGGIVPWGARTLRGAPALADEYNIVSVRRLALYILQWVSENTRWAVFQSNDETLWSALRLQLGTFFSNLWGQGALFGTSASQAFFINCDATNNTIASIKSGVVNIQIGFAPVRPAEFVVVTVQQSYSTAASS